jgi:hypothetical protein
MYATLQMLISPHAKADQHTNLTFDEDLITLINALLLQ